MIRFIRGSLLAVFLCFTGTAWAELTGTWQVAKVSEDIISNAVNRGSLESDSDFDHDGVRDPYEITIDNEIQLNIHLSSINEPRSYSWRHLDNSDDGFSNLYKYGGRNYIVYYYSDFRDNSEYVEDIYSWNPEVNEMVLYLTAEIQTANNKTSISTKMAKCCTVAGDNLTQPVYLDASESAVRTQELVDSMYLKIQNKQAYKYYFLDEEIAFLTSNYNIKNKSKYIVIADFYKGEGDEVSWRNIMKVVGDNDRQVH